DAYDLQGDPFTATGTRGNPNVLYTAIAGAGVFRSDDVGETWTALGGATFGTGTTWITNLTPTGVGTQTSTTVRIRLAVQANATGNVVYAGIVDHLTAPAPGLGNVVSGLLRSGDGGRTWVPMTLPVTIENGVPVGLSPGALDPDAADEPGGQGTIHF